MTMRRRSLPGSSHGGSWVISFADLMSLLMAFFVMLLSFSVQDQARLKQASGSVQDAFGITREAELAGIIELDGNPERRFVRDVSPQAGPLDRSLDGHPAIEANKGRYDADRQAEYALAAASIRQAFDNHPDITAVADNLILSPTDEGIDLVISDQQGRAMFPEGSKYPFEITRRVLEALAPLLNRLPNRIDITGHVAAGGKYESPRYGPWELSFDRANITRQILEEHGLSPSRVRTVTGSADTVPFFPGDPYLAANQRVTLHLIYEPPAVPAGLAP